MRREELEALLAEPESTHLDWKADFPKEILAGRSRRWDTGRAKLLRSLVSLANSEGAQPAHLIYGAKDTSGERQVVGVSRSFDDADFQQWAENVFDPPPTFRYAETRWKEAVIVGSFRIERTPDYPHVVRTSLGDVLYEGQVWFRRGSKNTVAHRAELQRMLQGESPFKISGLNDPVFEEICSYYRDQGREPTLPVMSDRDSLLARGYDLATRPGTRQEVWVGARDDWYEHILLLKPKEE